VTLLIFPTHPAASLIRSLYWRPLQGSNFVVNLHVSRSFLSFQTSNLQKVDQDASVTSAPSGPDRAKCDLIYHALFVLLIRTHIYHKSRRLSERRPHEVQVTPRLLHPVVDLLQYMSFCERIRDEMSAVVRSLRAAGVPTKFRFHAVGDNCDNLLTDLAVVDMTTKIGGDVTIRIDDRYVSRSQLVRRLYESASRTLRFVFHAPSALTAHLPQATLPISSITQLSQLLRGETEQCLLERICHVGRTHMVDSNSTWFVDPLTMKAVGKWEGCLLCVILADLQGHSS